MPFCGSSNCLQSVPFEFHDSLSTRINLEVTGNTVKTFELIKLGGHLRLWLTLEVPRQDMANVSCVFFGNVYAFKHERAGQNKEQATFFARVSTFNNFRYD